MEIRKAVCESLANVGITIPKDTDVDLNEYLVESFLFVSFLIEIEERLGVELPYEFYTGDNLKSLNAFCTMLEIWFQEAFPCNAGEK